MSRALRRAPAAGSALTTDPERPRTRSSFRPDIEGLRAIAVLAVLAWHAGLPIVSGGFVGVDVFFVISGYLMTNLLVRELEQSGRIDLPYFYARRARRLLPAALAALVGVALLTVAFLPRTRWIPIGWDIVSSALYVVNWRFAERSVDYLAQGMAASPVEHFWSLAVEEQFYLFWPVLLLGIGALAARRRARLRPVVGVTLGVIIATSLAWSIRTTADSPQRAYFVTTTRLWELAVGGVVAVVAPLVVSRGLRAGAANAIAGVGLLAVLVSLVTIDAATPFPGWVALVPTVGTALVLLAAPACGGAFAPTRLLAPRPMQWVGGISYALYLWHWPLLVVAAVHTADGELSTAAGTAVVVASFLPAWWSWRWVETPLRHRPHVRPRLVASSLRLGLVCTLLASVTGLALVAWTERSVERERVDAAAAPGAAVFADDPAAAPGLHLVDSVESITPPPVAAGEDLFAPFYRSECAPGEDDATVKRCVFGDPLGTTSIAVVGDSHAVMWMPAVERLGREHGWRVELIAKTSCPLADVAVRGPDVEACRAWNRDLLDELTAAPVDLVLVASASTYSPEALDRDAEGYEDRRRVVFAAGLARSWDRLTAAGTRVGVLMGVPRFDYDVPECVSRHRERLSSCAGAREVVLEQNNAALRQAVDEAGGAEAIDLHPYICPGASCPAVIGNVLVYADGNHLSATYVRTLAPWLRAAIEPLVPSG
jgi:peptidoglycan/LPS O-acetylase OafA/YrhL